jgi:hypothetical protein
MTDDGTILTTEGGATLTTDGGTTLTTDGWEPRNEEEHEANRRRLGQPTLWESCAEEPERKMEEQDGTSEAKTRLKANQEHGSLVRMPDQKIRQGTGRRPNWAKGRPRATESWESCAKSWSWQVAKMLAGKKGPN